MRRTGIFISFFLLLCGAIHAQKAQWETVELSKEITRSMSLQAIEQALIAEARVRAVESVTGIGVRKVESLATSERMEALDGKPKTTTQWYEDYMYYTRQETAGRIISEKPPVFKEILVDSRPHLSLTFKAEVAIDEDAVDPGFDATLRTSQPTYRVNDTIHISAGSTRDAELYLFSVSAAGQCTLIWPNTAEPENTLWAGHNVSIPKNKEKVSFIAELPKEDASGPAATNSVQEMLFGIFYRGDTELFKHSEAFSKTWTLAELNRILLRIPRKERMEVMEIYGIVE
jgi:hypothetical protein